jgi:ubiquinone/menaquinone biosynthesis C-methylase UbiE
VSTDLHQGFADVDRSARPQTLYEFLKLANSLPEFRAYKRVMRTALDLRTGDTLLDVGCGIGMEVRRIATERPDVTVIGLDREAMIAEAQHRAGDGLGSVRWMTGEAEDLPLPDDSVDACMTERVLKYLPDPGQAIAEMVRVLRPGGRIACFELDYASTMLGGDPTVAALVNDLLNDSVAEPRMGRRLPTMLRDAGLVDVATHLVIFSPPGSIYEATVANPVRDAIERGDLPQARTSAWLQSQADAMRTGEFVCAFIGLVVSARLAA